MPTERLFIGLWPEPEVREALVQWRDAWSWPRQATPTRTERLHMTLHFLGDVEQERIPELTTALCVPFEPFALALGHCQLWPHGIAVLEPPSVPAQLIKLHADVGSVVQQCGIALDARPYRPHITLARRAVGALVPAQGPAISWQVDRFALMQSRLGAGGGYATLQSYGPTGDILSAN